MERQCGGSIWHSGEHAVDLRGKGCTRLLMGTDRPGAFAARVLSMSIFHVCVSGIVLEFSARRRIVDGHDVCGGYLVKLFSKTNHFAKRIALRMYLTKDLFCQSPLGAESS